MVVTEAIKQAITQVTVQTVKATVLVISGEGRRQNMSTGENGAPEVTRYKTGTTLRQPVFNWREMKSMWNSETSKLR